MADEVILLEHWASLFVMRVKIALAEKGIKYECREENILDKSPLLLQMNPAHKKIPVLIHNGKPIRESLIIVEYIDEVWKDRSPLLPSDPYQRAQARFWVDYIDNKICDCAKRLWTKKGEDQEVAKKEFIECLKLMEGELGEKSYFGGETMGLLDLCFTPYYSWFYSFETFGNFSMAAECPKLVAWGKRCMENESVSNSLPDQHTVYDLLVQTRKNWFGIE